MPRRKQRPLFLFISTSQSDLSSSFSLRPSLSLRRYQHADCGSRPKCRWIMMNPEQHRCLIGQNVSSNDSVNKVSCVELPSEARCSYWYRYWSEALWSIFTCWVPNRNLTKVQGLVWSFKLSSELWPIIGQKKRTSEAQKCMYAFAHCTHWVNPHS